MSKGMTWLEYFAREAQRIRLPDSAHVTETELGSPWVEGDADPGSNYREAHINALVLLVEETRALRQQQEDLTKAVRDIAEAIRRW